MPGIIVCTSCGNEIASNSQFCPHCSVRLCPGCHQAVPHRSRYCPHCGFLIGAIQHGEMTQPTPPTPSVQAPGAEPRVPTPQPRAISQYDTDDQPVESYGHGPPSAMQYGKMRQERGAASGTRDTPSRPRRFPKAMVPVIIIVVICIAGFAAFTTGWLDAPLSTAQEFFSGIEWLPSMSRGSADTTPPAIQDITISNVTRTSAVITWGTDEPATTQVMICDPAGLCTWTELDNTLVTTHSVTINDLKSDTTYHFTAVSQDVDENTANSEGELTTLAPPDTTPPLISGVTISNITDLSATVMWKTDTPASSQVKYGTSAAYGLTTPLKEQSATNHSVTLTGLEPDTTYHFKVASEDTSGNVATSETDLTFRTLASVSPTSIPVGTEIGNIAPGFILETVSGQSIGLGSFKGKLVMINFWAEGYHACGTELPHIQAVFDGWSGKELVVLAVNRGESATTVQNFIDNKGLTFTVLLDLKGEVADKYNVNSIPTTFFIDADGIIREIKPRPLRNPTEIESILGTL